MGRLRGQVDRADKLLIAGWALDEDQPEARPLVQIMQRGQVVAATRTSLPMPQLRAALGLAASPHPPVYGWQVALPLAGGLLADLPFSVALLGGDGHLENGVGRVIRTVERIDPEAEADLGAAPLVQLDIQPTPEGVRFHLRVTQPVEEQELSITIGRQAPPGIEVRRIPAGPPFGRRSLRVTGLVPRGMLLASRRAALPLRLRYAGDEAEAGAAETRPLFHHRLRTLFLPRSLYDPAARRLPVPEEAELRRLSGPRGGVAPYLAGGITAFVQLDALARRFAGRPVTAFPTIVDFGVGLGRVLRHFAESAGPLGLPAAPEGQRLIGLDTDAASIAWCRARLPGLAEFGVLDPAGRFDLPEGSVDLLYGTTLPTRLGEFHQHLWLSEIRRVLRPGGLAILVVNGEAAQYRQPGGLGLPFVERFGLFDALEDPAGGVEQARIALVARPYIRRMWTRHLQVLEAAPATAGPGFAQDYVVLRRRRG